MKGACSQNDQRMRDERTRCSTKQCMQHGIQFHSSYRSTTYALERASGQIGLKRLIRLTRSSNWCTFFGSKNLKKSPAGKRTCLLPCSSCNTDSDLSLEQSWKKRMLSQLSNYEDKRNGVSQVQRAVVQPEIDRQVKREKKASCFILLRRITN